jgi:hypothetical protein
MFRPVRSPLHERWTPLRRIRSALRHRYYEVLRRTFASDDGRQIAWDAANSLRAHHPRALLQGLDLTPPYAGLGARRAETRSAERSDVVIITGRFRSGSTLLWNLFRQAGGFTAYYEPLNERRWFDPTVRGSRTDATHRNVSDYWREYDGLDVLAEYYHEDWIRRHLLMDEHFWAPKMKQYVDTLIGFGRSSKVLHPTTASRREPTSKREANSAGRTIMGGLRRSINH